MIRVSTFWKAPELARFSATEFTLGLGRPLVSWAVDSPQGSETTQMLFLSFLTPSFPILRTEGIIKSVENIAY